MRIATRLTIIFVLLTLVVTFSVGWFAVALSSRSQYATLDGTINSVVDSGLRNENTALSNALYVIQRDNYDLTLDVIFPSGEITTVNNGKTPLKGKPTIADVKQSLNGVSSVANLPGYEIRSLRIGGGDYLVVSGSTASIRRSNQHLALMVALAAVVIAIVSIIIGREGFRRDLRSMGRLIRYADDVSKGDEVGEIPPEEGSRDLLELRTALIVMVNALQERIDIEASTNKTMQQFIGDASHELRTPLTVVKGYNELLTSGNASPEQQQRALSRINSEVSRMEELVRDLLLLAEVREAPRHAMQIVDLSDIVRFRVSDFVMDQPARTVTSTIEEGIQILARKDLVERLIVNALTNITRHTPSWAPVNVLVQVSGNHAILLIEDGGEGLPAYGVRPQRFQRHDESRSRATGGSGLGMSIMADVAESFGGSLTTERSSLGGLGLRFRLPLRALE